MKERPMAQRVIAMVHLVRDADTKEWVCMAYDADGQRYPEADYYTEDKEDAHATMRAMVAPPERSRS